MKNVLFIRHAETDMAGQFCGHSNPPVNERGHRQIGELLRSLDGKGLDVVYTSDLQRAVTTADAIAAAFVIPCITKSGLREIDFGRWEGFAWQEIQERDEDYAHRWIDKFPKLPVPGGEHLDAFESRVVGQISEILSSTDYWNAAVVTHAGVMRVVLQTMCGVGEQDAWSLTKPYCSFFKYPYKAMP